MLDMLGAFADHNFNQSSEDEESQRLKITDAAVYNELIAFVFTEVPSLLVHHLVGEGQSDEGSMRSL